MTGWTLLMGHPCVKGLMRAANDIIQNHQPFPLPEGALETMEDIVKEFEKELGIA